MQELATSQDKSLVRKVAYQILSHFDKSYRWFTRITRGAQERFEKGNWKETQLASKERITIYEQSLSDAVAEIYQLTQGFGEEQELYPLLRLHCKYAEMTSLLG